MLPAICLEIPTEILSEISLVILQKVLSVIILLLTYSFGNSFQFLRFFFNSFVNIWVKFPMPSKKSSTTTLTFPSEIYLGIYLEISLGFLENVLIVYNNPVQNFPFYEKFNWLERKSNTHSKAYEMSRRLTPPTARPRCPIFILVILLVVASTIAKYSNWNWHQLFNS